MIGAIVALGTIKMVFVAMVDLSGYVWRQVTECHSPEVIVAYSWHYWEHCLWENFCWAYAAESGG
jgi:hypothetical protein